MDTNHPPSFSIITNRLPGGVRARMRWGLMLSALMALSLPLCADTYEWTGNAGDGKWGTAGNWTPTPGGTWVGVSNTLPDAVIFDTGAGTITTGTPVTGINLTELTFQSAGWTLNQNNYTITLRDGSALNSAGAGVNTINSYLRLLSGPSLWTIANGNTLHLARQASWIQLRSSLTKSGAGTLLIDASINTNETSNIGGGFHMTGGTTLLNSVAISNGTASDVEAGGSTAAHRYWSVASGATLGGNGTLQLGGGGTTTNPYRLLEISGTLSPGGDGTTIGGEAIGTFSFHSLGAENGESRIVMMSGSTLAMDLDAVDGVSDLLAFTREGTAGGYLDLTAGDITLALSGPLSGDLAIGNEYTLVTFSNTQEYGAFSTIMYNGLDVTDSPLFSLNYSETAITLTVVPEPSTLASLATAGGLLLLAWYRRRGRAVIH